MTAHINNTITLSDQTDISLNIASIRPWQEKWHETTNCLVEIGNIYHCGAPGTENIRRAVEAFFKACRELADWMEQSTGRRALAYVHSHPHLMICDAFAQVIKHHTRSKSGAMTARISRISGSSSGVRVAIAWRMSSHAPEQETDALALAQRCIAAWERFFTQEGLTLPA